MSFLLFLLLIALLIFIVALIRAVRKYRSKQSILPTTNYRPYSSDTRSWSYKRPVETQSRIPQSIFSSAPRTGSLVAPYTVPAAPRQLPPPIISPLPVAVRKSYRCSFTQDDLPVLPMEQVHRPNRKDPAQKTVEQRLDPVFRPSLELPPVIQKPPQYTCSRDSFPSPLGGHSHRPVAKVPVEVCIKPRPFQFFESHDEKTVIGEGRDEDDGSLEVKDLDHLALRELANQEFGKMKKCQREEKLAKRSRQLIRARELVVKAQHHRKRMQEFNDRASEVVFAEKNKDPTLRRIDLHGLTVKEAIDRTNRVLKQARELGNAEIRLIVGKGNHSPNGVAKVKPAIQTFLKKHQFPVEVDSMNDGVLVVQLDSALGSSGMCV